MFISFTILVRPTRIITEHTTLIHTITLNSVLMMVVISLRFFAPNACAISTCPALAKPRHTIVTKFSIKLLCATAERPGVPTYFPTITISIVLYNTCKALDAINGSINQNNWRGIFPVVKSFDKLFGFIKKLHTYLIKFCLIRYHSRMSA